MYCRFQLTLNDYLNRSLVEVGLETGGQSRNKLIITDAGPRRQQRAARGPESGDHAGRTSPVAPGAQGGPDSAPAFTYASGLIKSNETGAAEGRSRDGGGGERRGSRGGSS